MGGVFGRTNYEVDRSVEHEKHQKEKKDANLTFPVSNKPPKRGKLVSLYCISIHSLIHIL